MIAGLGLPEPLSLDINGGTDVPGAPSCTYIKHVKMLLLKTMGYSMEMTIKERGYFPRGGGTVQVRLIPPESLQPIRLLAANSLLYSRGVSHASEALASRRVAERQKQVAQKILTQYLHIPSKIESIYSRTRSIGSSLVIWAEATDTALGATCLGKRNMSSEDVAEKATGTLIRSYHSGASLDPWMGDQILPYLALTGQQSEITVPYITKHMLTNIWVIEKFLNVRFSTEEIPNRVGIVCKPLAA
jgi:RNA 3'-phosphate cyclase